MADQTNRFERHAKTISAIFFIFIGMVILAGGYFAYSSMRKDARKGYERHIVLRECSPLSESFHEGGKYVRHGDENGFIAPSRIHDNPEYEIVFLGGSTTECLNNDEDKRFPYLAGRLLEEKTGKRTNAYNGGKSGSSANHSVLALLAKVVPMQPDTAVLMHNINDLMFLTLAGTYWADHGRRGMTQEKAYNPLKKWFITKETGHEFTDIPRTDYDPYRGKRAILDVDRVTTDFAKMLEMFIFICRQYDIQPVLMTQFNRISEKPDAYMGAKAKRIKEDFGIEYPAFVKAYAAMNDTIRRVAREQHVQLIDLAQSVPGTGDFIYDSVHLTEKGSALVAKVIADNLTP